MNYLLDLCRHRPNLIVTGVAHSGTSIVARMLIELGSNRLEADYGNNTENSLIYDVNQSLIAERPADWDSVRRLLAGRNPWMVKDPHFVFTLDRWVPMLSEFGFRPVLLCITRDHDSVINSWNRRGEGLPDAAPHVAVAERMCRQQIDRWPWERIVIDYEKLSKAAAMFNVKTEVVTQATE